MDKEHATPGKPSYRLIYAGVWLSMPPNADKPA